MKSHLTLRHPIPYDPIVVSYYLLQSMQWVPYLLQRVQSIEWCDDFVVSFDCKWLNFERIGMDVFP